jgi:Fe2+ transport system protein FeoA
MHSLWNLSVNATAIIDAISETLDSKYRQRLADLGIVPGEEIFCVRNTPFGGPKIYQLRESLFSFDREISENITVHFKGIPANG